MGISGEIALAIAKKYTDQSMEGGGAVAGKNCTISSITPITGGNRVTFAWELDDGTEQTQTMDVMDGADGAQGQQGPAGEGVPSGGTLGQVLIKSSNTNYDTEWADAPSGSARHKYNVTEYGVTAYSTSDTDKEGTATANVTALQNLIDTVPEGSIIYFPAGRYDFNDGVTITRKLGFLGEANNFKTATAVSGDNQPRSQVVLTKSFPANTTMFDRTQAIAVSFKFLSIICNTSTADGSTNPFYTQPTNTATFSTYPYPYYVVPEHFGKDGVNGIDASQGEQSGGGMFEISNCYFKGFTGDALKVGQHRFIDQCGFDGCKTGVEVTHTDSWVANCWFRSCYNAIHAGTISNSLLAVSDCWADQLAGHFIYCDNPTSVVDGQTVAGNIILLVDNAWVDMVDQSAICVETTAYMIQSRINGRFSRVGMTYAGLKNSEWTKEKSPLSDVIFAARYDYCNFDIIAPKREIHKVGSTSYECPCKVIGLYNSGTSYSSGTFVHNSRFVCVGTQYEDIIPVSLSATTSMKPPVAGYNFRDVHIVARDGEFVPYSNVNFKYPVMQLRTSTPKGNIKAARAGDFALDTAAGTLYQSTAENNTSAWDVLFCKPTNGALMVAKVDSLPTASASELGNTYMYMGASDATSGLAHGSVYECVSDGASTPTYSWQVIALSVEALQYVLTNSNDFAAFKTAITAL